MKKKCFVLSVVFILVSISLSAQCIINTGNTMPGITGENPDDTLTPGIAYSQSFQVYIPGTYAGNTIDSVHLTVTGAPEDLTVIYLPSDEDSATIAGGSQGVICFSGITYDTVGFYPLTFEGTVYSGTTTVPLASLEGNFSYTFYVNAPAPQGYLCDTVININLSYDDTAIIPLTAPNVGYLSGNGGFENDGHYFPFVAVGEKLIGGIGDSVTGALVQFGYVTINPGDSGKLVDIYLYVDNGPLGNGDSTGGPGTVIDSAFLSFRTISTDVQNFAFSNVTFSNGAKLTSPGFFIVVKLPTTPGDTVVIFTNTASTANGAGYLDVNAWYAYTELAGLTTDSLGNFIAAAVCGNEPDAPGPGFNVSPPNLCLGTAADFNNVTLGSPTAFSWNFGDGSPLSTLFNPTHIYADTGVYLVSLTASNAGGSVTYSAFVRVFANPVATGLITNATSSTSINGSVVVSVTVGSAPFTFTWSTGAGNTDTLVNVAPGTYEVTITDSNSCVSADTFLVSYSNSINFISLDAQIKVYPNPANDLLFIQSGGTVITQLQVINTLGQILMVNEVNADSYRLGISSLVQGNYLLLLHTANGIVKQFINIARD